MLDEIGSGVAAGFRTGVRIGQEIQNEKAIDAWSAYAARLEATIEQYKMKLQNATVDVEIRDNMLAMQERKFRDYIAKVNAINAEAEKTKKRLESRGFDMRGLVCVYEDLYRQLINEIDQQGQVENYNSLKDDVRESVIVKKSKEFEGAKNEHWLPDLQFSYIKNRKN